MLSLRDRIQVLSKLDDCQGMLYVVGGRTLIKSGGGTDPMKPGNLP